MKEVHLTNESIPGVRRLREMKASTNKRRRDNTYGSERHKNKERIRERSIRKSTDEKMPKR